MTLQPNEVLCLKCNGTGYAARQRGYGAQRRTTAICAPCNICGGSGKIDWVKQITRGSILDDWWEKGETVTEEERMELFQRIDTLEKRIEDMESRVDDAESKVDDLESNLNEVQPRSEDSETKIYEMETRISDLESDRDDLVSKTDELEKTVDDHEERIKDMDDHEERIKDSDSRVDDAESRTSDLEDITTGLGREVAELKAKVRDLDWVKKVTEAEGLEKKDLSTSDDIQTF